MGLLSMGSAVETTQKKRKTTRRFLFSSSKADNYPVNDYTDESLDRNENGNVKCLYGDGLFSENILEEQ